MRRRIAGFIAAAVLLAALPGAPARAADIQQQRAEYIQKLVRLGVITKLDKPALLCHLWVAPRFYALDFDLKKTIAGVVWGYCSDRDPRARIVILKDSRSGKTAGKFSPQFGLKLN